MSIRKVPTCEEAKEQIGIVDYLASLGYQPHKHNDNVYWYYSPLHDENTPSFRVNMNMNAWKDWGLGLKGNLIDFGIEYHKCTVSQFLQKLADANFTIKPKDEFIQTVGKRKVEEKKEIEITKVRELFSFPLLNYLRQRRIPEQVARQFCKEVHYRLHDNNYYAIGFKNDAGGYELRNQYIKAASSPKAPTFIDNGVQELAVFEGFFNFLSYKTMLLNQQEPQRNFLILNSTSFFQQQLPKMQDHNRCYLYLDNDKTGAKFTDIALAVDKQKFSDERKIYHGGEDLNDWLVNIGKTQRNTLHPKL